MSGGVATISSTAAFWRRRRADADGRIRLPTRRGRRSRRRQQRFAIVLARPEQSTLRALAAVASGSEAAICDLGAAVDGVWAKLLPADRDMLGYHLRAAGAGTTLRRASRSWMPRRRMRAAAAIGNLRLAESARVLIGALEQGAVPEHELVQALGAPTPCGRSCRRSACRARWPCARRSPMRSAALAPPRRPRPWPRPCRAASASCACGSCGRSPGSASPAAVEAVPAAMSDPHGRVRAQAAWSLARLGDAEAAALLERGLTDSAPWVRASCTAALRRLAGR
jgi:HEAT repeat protein